MTRALSDDLWREFPKTAPEFEKRFASEEDWRAYWIKARWGGEPAGARCASTRQLPNARPVLLQNLELHPLLRRQHRPSLLEKPPWRVGQIRGADRVRFKVPLTLRPSDESDLRDSPGEED